MKSLEHWLKEYSLDHQNPLNQKLHKIAVPIIFFSAHGLLLSIPAPFFWPVIMVDCLALIFYFRLSLKCGLIMATVMAVQAIILALLSDSIAHLWLPMAALFIIAWILQFYGHYIEGRKPSFTRDLGYLLIGPLWVIGRKISAKVKIQRSKPII